MPHPSNHGATPKEGWRYVVLLAKFGNHLLQQGVMKSLGVLIPSLVVQLDSTYSTVGLLLSLQLTMYYMACPLAHILIQKYDVRLVSTLGGIGTALPIICASFTRLTPVLGIFFFLSGACSSALGQASTVLMHQHFGEQFGSANSISFLGSIAGGMLVPFVGAKLLEAYGLFGALLCLGGLFLNCIPIGASLRPPRSMSQVGKSGKTKEPETQELMDRHEDKRDSIDAESCQTYLERDGKAGATDRRTCWMILDRAVDMLGLKLLLKEPYFALFFLPCQVLFDVVFIGWALFMVSYAISVGIDEQFAVFLPVAAATGGFVSRTTLALIMRYKSRWSPGIYALCVGVSGVALFVYQLHSTLNHLLVSSFFAGVGMYGAACTFYTCLSVIVSDAHFSGIVALSYCVSGIGTASAGVLAGYIYDVTQSFRIVFSIFGGLMLCVCFVIVVYILIERRFNSVTSASYKRAPRAEHEH
ncbi:monocarboxylate transporter 2-like [Diadema antillarum]|uniref:monocarboxylate transporter 2-like n=1 Tax=Diadema antillarum TaxID=105358 RepID=UPI003A8B2B87